MHSRNRVDLIGHVGGDPKRRVTTANAPYTTISLATHDTWKGPDGKRPPRTEWHSVVFWGNLAEVAAAHLKKGSYVSVEGELRSREIGSDGSKRRVWHVKAKRLGFLEPLEKGADLADAAVDDTAPTSDDEAPF
jgi:single-strand DNA-binding protein